LQTENINKSDTILLQVYDFHNLTLNFNEFSFVNINALSESF